MKRSALFFTGILLSISSVFAGDAALDENSLKRAQALAHEGDILGALPVMFAISRQTANTDLANEARESLQHLGVTSQEVFKLDLSAMKGEELDKLLARLRSIATVSCLFDAKKNGEATSFLQFLAALHLCKNFQVGGVPGNVNFSDHTNRSSNGLCNDSADSLRNLFAMRQR